MADQPVLTEEDQAELEARARTVALRANIPAPLENTGIYGEDGKLTREGMEKVVRAGGSVTYGNAHLWRVEDLPTEAQLAKGDQRKAAAAQATIQEQIAALQAQLGMLTGSKPADAHPGERAGISTSQPFLPGDVAVGTLGEGDTAGLDGDMSDPDSIAAQKEARRQERLAAEAAERSQVAEEVAEGTDTSTDDGKANSKATKPAAGTPAKDK